MIRKTLFINIFLLFFFFLSSFEAVATEAGQCATRNDCDDCPRKTVQDCACKCSSPAGNDPGCSSNEFNGYPSLTRCVGDLSCLEPNGAPTLARCIVPECTCTPGEIGGGTVVPTLVPGSTSIPQASPNIFYSSIILGRIFLDSNRNGSYNLGEPLLMAPTGSCGNFQKSEASIKVISKKTGQETNLYLDKCNPEPYFMGSFENGGYDVRLITPEGYESMGPVSVSVNLENSEKHVWFAIAKINTLNCQLLEVPAKICLGESGILKATSNVSGVIYKWESGCLNFPSGGHVYTGQGKEVSVSPSSLGSCQVKLSASINGADYYPCGSKYVILDDCRVSCLAITSVPNIVKVGEPSEVSVSVDGEPPFSYLWSTPVSDCKIEGSGDIVKVTAERLPSSSLGNICPVSVMVTDRNSSVGAACSTNISVIEDTSPFAYSWFKTLKGDVISYNSISDNIPVGEFFSDYVVKSVKGSVFDFTVGRTGRERASRMGWLVDKTKFSSFAPFSDFFDYFIANYPAEASISESDISQSYFNNSVDYLITPGLGQPGVSVRDKITARSDVISRFYINGDLNIEKDIEMPGGSAVLFVVRGNLNISSAVKIVEGAFLVDGTVNLTDRLGSSDPLYLKGLLAVSSKGKLFGLSRKSASAPSEIFVYDPKYLVKLTGFFNKPSRVWLEVSP